MKEIEHWKIILTPVYFEVYLYSLIISSLVTLNSSFSMYVI